ncbi:MAG: flagellar biosynthetic protein FliQ [Synergistaceae bacterium]|jgi:flagellar biosynthetic protein FliQ|nr:flagellar biosynthetic protein FliQ [Synergistaceae bacterium]
METLSISDALNAAMWVIVIGSMPILLVAMGVGLIVGILQTATSIQEQTLSFIPKILAVIFALAVFGPWIFRIVGDMAVNFFTDMYKYVM